jgi:hypothetical protein
LVDDLHDVIALVQTLRLATDFADKLSPDVRDKYIGLWPGIQDCPTGPVEP